MEAKDWLDKGKKKLQSIIKGEELLAPKKGQEAPPLSVSEKLLREGMMSGDDSNEKLARQFGLEVRETITGPTLPRDIYKKVPYTFSRKHLVLPIEQEGSEIVVVCTDPLNLEPIEDLRLLLGTSVKTVWAKQDVVLTAINDFYNIESGEASRMITEMKDQSELSQEGEFETYDLLDHSREQSPIIKLLNLILTEAIQQNASDIHFEPMEDRLRVRYRIDGVLHTRHTPSAEYSSQLLTRIKVMAKMDIAERRLPQDGRIKLRMGRREIDFRVSTVPIIDGERIVLRILDKGNVNLGLDQLGMAPALLKEFERLIAFPEGILLVTGPTGSGKTTTLYSAVSDIYSDEINIMTIEDPVEYNLRGIAQIGVKPKIDLTFAAGLRTILRQDPDVVMVGEIRDLETAEIAIQASLTGHLVLSTLHTNDAPSAITRLVDMGIEPYLLSSSLVGVMAQRLVRQICSHCKKEYTPDDSELKSLGIIREELPEGKLYFGEGCDHCFDGGFLGRHGVYELLTITPALQHQIVRSADAVELREKALHEHMHTLKMDGARLVKEGITTISEVLRVIRGAQED